MPSCSNEGAFKQIIIRSTQDKMQEKRLHLEYFVAKQGSRVSHGEIDTLGVIFLCRDLSNIKIFRIMGLPWWLKW